jgi:hypothetical protein
MDGVLGTWTPLGVAADSKSDDIANFWTLV